MSRNYSGISVQARSELHDMQSVYKMPTVSLDLDRSRAAKVNIFSIAIQLG